MKKLLLSIAVVFSVVTAVADNLFFYSPSDGSGGLRFAVKDSSGNWKAIGNGYDFVRSDFGAWGSHKKMWNPQLFPTSNGGWAILFRADPKGEVIGWAESPDFISWKPQKYIAPIDTSKLTFRTNQGFLPAAVELNGETVSGSVMNVEPSLIASLESYVEERGKLNSLYSETCSEDAARFNGLGPVEATLTATGFSYPISDMLMGIFFEDINYAADGGLYAELVQNRDFEYTPGEGHAREWGPQYAWNLTGDKIGLSIETDDPIHPNNPHFARLDVKGGVSTLVNGGGNALVNSGYDGIPLKKGEPYRFRMKARSAKKMLLEVDLVSEAGRKLASGKINVVGGKGWMDYELVLTPDEHSAVSSVRIIPKNNGILDLDMVSLFPVNTYKGRENGLRADLAQTLADLKPRFVRFPGGCVAHGNGIDNIYDWKGSIGKLEERKPLFNLWGYHQSRGLGYHEYFQFCEDIGAEPLPVVAAGVPCQNSSHPYHLSHDALTTFGQQGGIPMDSLDSYIKDILDLIEYANGPATSEWGSKRAKAGHPEPFNLKYIGIGNEDMITEIFEERFKRINDAVKAAYPEIKVIGTVGPFYEGSDYEEGWRFAKEQNIDLVDEHYYVPPGWLIYNQNYYDGYDRKGTKVYLGEWASHLPGRPSNLETALSEALYLTAVERNGDVVSMSSYAPLLAKDGHTQWWPDLIYFSNTDVRPTTDYEVMKLYGENPGTIYMKSTLEVASDNEKVAKRVGTSIVRDEKTGEIILKMVNMLPVETALKVDLSALYDSGTAAGGSLNAKRTVMSGNPADTKASVKTDRVSLESSLFTCPLPPYSFTVMRIMGTR